MVTLDTIREEMRKRLEMDKELHSVEVHADTIDEALRSTELLAKALAAYLKGE